MTDGFDVFVQLVIAAMTTEPWSSSKLSPSEATATGLDRRVEAGAAVGSGSATGACPGAVSSGGSLAGNDSANASSCEPFG
jgi:hypothetical protein